jgi:hypothetical protein
MPIQRILIFAIPYLLTKKLLLEMKKLFALALCITASLTLTAQCCPYNAAPIILPNGIVASGTNVRIALHVTTPNLGYKLSLAHTISGSTIAISGCYYSGLATALQDFYDTLSLGVLADGVYTVNFVALQTASPTNCIPQDSTITTAQIVVGNTNGVAPQILVNSAQFHVTPIGQGYFTVTAPHSAMLEHLAFYNMAGNKLAYTKLAANTYYVPHLASGIYFATSTHQGNMLACKFIVQ